MSLQYLEALKQIGQSPSTKFVIPMEFTNLLSGITDYAEQTFGNGRPARSDTARGTGGVRPV